MNENRDEKDVKIINLINNDICFNLQFRKDVKKERPHSPTYYRWKVQFVVTNPKENIKILEELRKELNCGKVYICRGQAHFSVQNISEIKNQIIPYFQKNPPLGKKKKDFELWNKAVEIIYKNKGLPLSQWKKKDFNQLLEIYKLSLKYKSRPRRLKWLTTAQDLAKMI